MTGLGTELAPEIFAACQTGAAEASAALSRCFEQPFELTPSVPQALQSSELDPIWQGPGLALVLVVQEEAAVLFLPHSAEQLSAWHTKPADKQSSARQLLAQELSMVLLPDSIIVDDCLDGNLNSLSTALQKRGDGDVCGITFSVAGDPSTPVALLIWPVSDPRTLITQAETFNRNEEQAAKQSTVAPPPAPPPKPAFIPRDLEEALPIMPPYIRSLLRIEVQVAVTLAQTSYPVKKILALAPGSIIQFDKSYDQPLELHVGDKCVGVGEAVKCGEKYGLRLTSMALPEERFSSIGTATRRVG